MFIDGKCTINGSEDGVKLHIHVISYGFIAKVRLVQFQQDVEGAQFLGHNPCVHRVIEVQ